MNYQFSLKKLKLRNKKSKGNLPFCFLFSDRKKISDLKKSINFLPKNSAVIIREYDLVKEERKKFAAEIVDLTRKKQIFSFIGKDAKLGQSLGASGIHFSDFNKISVTELKKYQKKYFISFAIHSEKSLQKINKTILQKYIDVIFLSPIFTTSSHENRRLIGLRNFRKILRNSRKNIFALGGINQRNLRFLLKEKNFRGFGAIDLFASYCEREACDNPVK